MMGTLAIMGILALSGIWMYNSAMDRLKANTIINEAQKRAVVVAGQIGFLGRTNPSLGEFSDNTFAGGTFSTDVVTSGLYEQFGIQVSNVPKRICQNILNTIGDTTPIRRLAYTGSPTNAITTCNEDNTFLIVYNNDMSSSGNDPEYASGNCGCQTTCGQCVVENGETRCAGECPVDEQVCSSNADCSGDCVGCVIPSGQSQGTCQACQRVEYLESTATQWIDTGIVPTYSTKLDCIFNTTADEGSNSRNYIFGCDSSGRGIQYSYSPSTFYGAGGMSVGPFALEVDRNLHSIAITKSVFTFDDEVIFTGGTNYTTSRTLKIFGSDSGHYGKLRMYSFKMWKGDDFVIDFVPVHAPFKEAGKQNCMFNRVSGTLFCK